MLHPASEHSEFVFLYRWLILFGIFFSVPALSQESQWRWVRVAPLQQDWEILEGMADVSIAGHQLTATLYDKQNARFRRFSIAGTISGKKISVIETRLHSDVSPVKLKGRFSQVDCGTKIDDCGYLITLSDEWVYLGLLRAKAMP